MGAYGEIRMRYVLEVLFANHNPSLTVRCPLLFKRNSRKLAHHPGLVRALESSPPKPNEVAKPSSHLCLSISGAAPRDEFVWGVR